MIGFYINLYTSLVSFFVSLVLLFYIFANPFTRNSFSAYDPYYVAYAIGNIIRCVGIFLGERYCVSYGYYIYIGGCLYISYNGVMQGLSFNEFIRLGRLGFVFKLEYFIVMNIIYIIQMILGVYFDNGTTSEDYCTYNMQNLEYDFFFESFTCMAIYPLAIAWTSLTFIMFYGAFVLSSTNYSVIMQPLVRRLRYYIVLIQSAVVPCSIYIIANLFLENVNYLFKISLFTFSIVLIAFQLDYFLFMNPLMNPKLRRQRRILFQVALDPSIRDTSETLNEQVSHDTTWLHLLFIKWDQFMYGSSSSANGSSQVNVSCVLVSESVPPSEYYDESADSPLMSI